jgi:hypothetical protein
MRAHAVGVLERDEHVVVDPSARAPDVDLGDERSVEHLAGETVAGDRDPQLSAHHPHSMRYPASRALRAAIFSHAY